MQPAVSDTVLRLSHEDDAEQLDHLAPRLRQNNFQRKAEWTKSSTCTIRCAVLHGEASDAALQEMVFRLTNWIDALASVAHFVFLDAPHDCAPRVEWFERLHAEGLYNKPSYRSWGLSEEGDERGRIARSVELVQDEMAKSGQMHAIAGVCLGSLIAASVAGLQDVPYINIAGGGPEPLYGDDYALLRRVRRPSLHLIGLQDELYSHALLMKLPSLCNCATLVQHERGHVVPILTGGMLSQVEAFFGQLFHGIGLAPEDPVAAFDAPERSAEQTVDSTALLMQARSNRPSQQIALDVMTFCATTIIMIHHYQPWLCRNPPVDDPGKICAHMLHNLRDSLHPTLMPAFALISGLRSARRRSSAAASMRQALILLALTVIYHHFIGAIHQKFLIKWMQPQVLRLGHRDPRLMCGDTSMLHRRPWWDWYFLLLAAYKMLDALCQWRRWPPWSMAAASAVAHVACVGGACPLPFCLDAAECRLLNGELFQGRWVLGFSQTFAHFAPLWPFYALLPLILPTDFPLVLPFEAGWTARTDDAPCRKSGVDRMKVSDDSTPSRGDCTPHGWQHTNTVRLAWVVVAIAFLARDSTLLPSERFGGLYNEAYGLFRRKKMGSTFVYVANERTLLTAITARLRCLWSFTCLSVFLVAVGAAMPRSAKRSVLSDAGAYAIWAYLLHPLVAPFVHPYPVVYAVVDALSALTHTVIGTWAQAVFESMRSVLILIYMISLQVVISRPPPLPALPLTLHCAKQRFDRLIVTLGSFASFRMSYRMESRLTLQDGDVIDEEEMTLLADARIRPQDSPRRRAGVGSVVVPPLRLSLGIECPGS